MKKRKRILPVILFGFISLLFLLPTLLTFTHAFFGEEELAARYGAVFDSVGNASKFTDARLLPFPTAPTLKQFWTVLFQSPDYLYKFWNSVGLALPITLCQVGIAAMAAYSLARVRSKFRSALFFFYVLLLLMPYQVTLVPNYILADKLGILGSRWAVLFPGAFAPFSVFLLARAMQRIPSHQFEAAALDGAGEWRLFTRIALPQVRGVAYAVAILVFIDNWNMVEQPLVLLGEESQYPLSVFLSEINQKDAAIAFAAAVIYMLPPLLLFWHGERRLAAGIAGGDAGEDRPRRRWAAIAAGTLAAALGALTLLLPRIMARTVPAVTAEGVKAGSVAMVAYEYVVPDSALYREGDTWYLFTVEERESALGARWVARRVEVTVLARGDRQAAVRGELTYWDRVIVSAAFPPEDGGYVQISERPA